MQRKKKLERSLGHLYFLENDGILKNDKKISIYNMENVYAIRRCNKEAILYLIYNYIRWGDYEIDR